jgi:phospholipid/cholesterol/gamma-HCH transport system substrate-binding protein
METEGRYFTVGIFVSLCLLAMVGFVIWLAGVHRTGQYDRYTIYFTDPVSGLDSEATVKYKGVEVGKVLDLRLTPERNDLIKVDIEVKNAAPVHAQTKAQIALQGVTGQNYIELTTEAGDTQPPQRLPGERYPVLKGSGSETGKFMDNLPRLSQQFTTTLLSLDEMAHGGANMADSIRTLADKLKEDPSQILRSPPNKGVEIPK